MLTIAQLYRRNNSEYVKPLRAKVIARRMSEQNFLEVALADQSDVIKAINYCQQLNDKLQVNHTLIIRNFKMGRRNLMLNSTTKVTKSAMMDVPDDVQRRADRIFEPPANTECSIKNILDHTVPSDSLASVTAIVDQDEAPRSVRTSYNTPTKVRNVSLRSENETIGIVLWGEKTQSPVKVGDRVHITHLAQGTDKKFNIPNLQTTQHSKIEVLAPEIKTIQLNIIGIESEHDADYVVLVITDQDDTETFVVNKQLIRQILSPDDPDIDEPALLALMCESPLIRVQMQGQRILEKVPDDNLVNVDDGHDDDDTILDEPDTDSISIMKPE